MEPAQSLRFLVKGGSRRLYLRTITADVSGDFTGDVKVGNARIKNDHLT